MRIEVMDGSAVVDTIIADEITAEQLHPGAWRMAPVQDAEDAVVVKRRMSVLAFRKRYSRAERAAIECAAADHAKLPKAQCQRHRRHGRDAVARGLEAGAGLWPHVLLDQLYRQRPRQSGGGNGRWQTIDANH